MPQTTPLVLTADRYVDAITCALDNPTGGLRVSVLRAYKEMTTELDRRELEVVRNRITTSWVQFARALQGVE